MMTSWLEMIKTILSTAAVATTFLSEAKAMTASTAEKEMIPMSGIWEMDLTILMIVREAIVLNLVRE